MAFKFISDFTTIYQKFTTLYFIIISLIPQEIYVFPLDLWLTGIPSHSYITAWNFHWYPKKLKNYDYLKIELLLFTIFDVNLLKGINLPLFILLLFHWFLRIYVFPLGLWLTGIPSHSYITAWNFHWYPKKLKRLKLFENWTVTFYDIWRKFT